MIAFSLLFAAGASAQDRLGSDFSPRETRKIVHEYGACIVKRQRARAAEAIIRNVDSSILLKEYPRLMDGQCLPFKRRHVLQARFSGDQYRYALADALARVEFANQPAPLLNAVPILDHRDPQPPSRTNKKGRPLPARAYEAAMKEYEEAKALHYLSRYGECVVRVNPAAARALLLTLPESPQEAAQFGAMREAFATCLTQGQTLSFGKLGLRGTIAVNYYRLAHAATRVSVTGTPR